MRKANRVSKLLVFAAIFIVALAACSAPEAIGPRDGESAAFAESGIPVVNALTLTDCSSGFHGLFPEDGTVAPKASDTGQLETDVAASESGTHARTSVHKIIARARTLMVGPRSYKGCGATVSRYGDNSEISPFGYEARSNSSISWPNNISEDSSNSEPAYYLDQDGLELISANEVTASGRNVFRLAATQQIEQNWNGDYVLQTRTMTVLVDQETYCVVTTVLDSQWDIYDEFRSVDITDDTGLRHSQMVHVRHYHDFKPERGLAVAR